MDKITDAFFLTQIICPHLTAQKNLTIYSCLKRKVLSLEDVELLNVIGVNRRKVD